MAPPTDVVTERVAAQRTAGWLVRHVTLPTSGSTDWRWLASTAQDVLQQVLSVGAVEVEVWFTEPGLLLAVVERLWHHGVRTSVIVDPRVLPEDSRRLLRTSRPSDAGARAALDACAYADRVVTLGGVDVSLLGTYDGIFGQIEVVPDGGPVSAPPASTPRDGLRLTVLVTTFDRPEALDSCLEALSASTLPKVAFDVVVVDDGSPQPAAPVVAAHHHHLDVRVVTLTENVGLGAARTTGLDHVRAGLTLLLDDDDQVTPRCLEEHLLAHEQHPDEMVAVLGATSVLPDGESTALSRHVTVVGRQYFAYPIVRQGKLNSWRAFWGGRSSAKTSLLRRHGFQAPFMEDADFALRARDEGLQVVYAGRALQVVTDRLSLSHFRRRQNKIGHAMHDLATVHDTPDVRFWAGLDPVTANLQHWVGQRDDLCHVLDRLLDQPVDALRATPWEQPHQPPASMLQLLDHALLIDLDAHYAAGMLAAASRLEAAAEGRRVRIGSTATDPSLEELVTALDGREGLEAVVLVATETEAAAVARRLEGVLLQLTHDANVEVLISAGGLADQDIDLVLPGSMGPRWERGMPAPLIGQNVSAWVSQIDSPQGLRGNLR